MRTSAQRTPTRGLTEGAILAALTVVVAAAGLVIPPVGTLLAPLPLMLLVMRRGLRVGVVAAIVVGLILLQFFGPLNAFLAVLFAPIGLALGWGVRRGIGPSTTIFAGAAASIAPTVANIALAMFVLHYDIIGKLISAETEGFRKQLEWIQRVQPDSPVIKQMQEMLPIMPQFLHALVPLVLLIGVLSWSYCVYLIARAVLRPVGHEIPPAPPMRTWRISLPLATGLLYGTAAIAIASFRVPGLGVAVANALYLNICAFSFQGALVGIALMSRRQIPRFTQIIVGLLFFQLAVVSMLPIFALTIVGMLDSWFDFRRLKGPAVPALPTSAPAPDSAAAVRDPSTRAGKRRKERRERAVKVVHPQ